MFGLELDGGIGAEVQVPPLEVGHFPFSRSGLQQELKYQCVTLTGYDEHELAPLRHRVCRGVSSTGVGRSHCGNSFL
jgi:hypothetical protein